ncbi:DUF4097 family beta strand repeat-containing protein [Nonomuraea basaltis]|uniref:DUF4097 family beta strand repeat-containing protein n=1 Tax=Nonomuraea basaltis TaxID=2495887 RepID=UPI00110C5C13|nr:DUF4097 family beta strand repeat-containing protein [Nonomuraea basaltis]TMR94614.1 DUF4097 domain-containing protein [Nonomuraea basaltis]
MRAAWLAAGAVVTVIALVVSTTALWRGFARARTPVDTTQRSIPFAKDKVEIKGATTQVSVIVLAGEAGELLIHRTLRWSRDRPDITEDWEAATSTLRLEAACPGSDQPDGPVCRADYVIFVPPETDIVADTTGGELAVNDIFGSVRLTTVSGDVRVHNISGPIWARTGTGDVDAERLDGDTADVEVGSGNVDLSFVNPPMSVRAVVRTAGDVRVNVPTGLYDLTVDAANTTLDVKKDDESPRKITAKAPGGSVSLCCR